MAWLWAGIVLGSMAAPADGQEREGDWVLRVDPQVDLWYHGMALVGYQGTARLPLYDLGYARHVAQSREAEGSGPTPLVARASALRPVLEADPAFEVFHFLPLYLVPASIPEAMDALRALAGGRGDGHHDHPGGGHGAVAGLGAVLSAPHHRRALDEILSGLQAEQDRLPGLPTHDPRTSGLGAAWAELTRGSFGEYLDREQLNSGEILLVRALGPEGRFLHRDGSHGLVAVGARADTPVDVVLGSVIRELCHPPVRRALRSFESRLGTRSMAVDVSARTVTRCGELLIREHAPHLLSSYQSRYGVVEPGEGFLSAAGYGPAVAAMERAIEAALLRETHLNNSGPGAPL